MGIELSDLRGQALEYARKEIAKQAKAGKPVESGLEARFSLYLRELGAPPARRNVKLNTLVEGMGKHEADFLFWRKSLGWPWNESKVEKEFLAIFIDGAVHGLKGRIDDSARRDNMATLILPSEWTTLRFCETQLESGAQAVMAWLAGDLDEMIKQVSKKRKR